MLSIPIIIFGKKPTVTAAYYANEKTTTSCRRTVVVPAPVVFRNVDSAHPYSIPLFLGIDTTKLYMAHKLTRRSPSTGPTGLILVTHPQQLHTLLVYFIYSLPTPTYLLVLLGASGVVPPDVRSSHSGRAGYYPLFHCRLETTYYSITLPVNPMLQQQEVRVVVFTTNAKL